MERFIRMIAMIPYGFSSSDDVDKRYRFVYKAYKGAHIKSVAVSHNKQIVSFTILMYLFK